MLKVVVLSLSVFAFGCSGVQIEEMPIRNTDMILEVIKTNAHPFLAEYDFRLVIKSHGKEIDVVDMTGDTGGLSRIIVLRLDEHTIAFKDHAKTVCMNLVKKGFEDCLGKRGGLDVGYFDFDSSHKWRFISESVKY